MRLLPNKKKLFLVSLLGAFIFAGCTQPAKNTPLIIKEKTYLINDSAGKIYRTPFQISSESDKSIDFLVYPNYLVRYNLESQKLLVLFDSIRFNIDSLVDKTYQIINKNKFKYLPHTPIALLNANKNLYQLAPYLYSKENYYIPIGIKSVAQFVYPKDQNKMERISKMTKAQLIEQRKIDSMQRLYPNSNIASEQINNFIIVTDKKFNQLNAFPLNTDLTGCRAAKLKRGFVFNNHLYFSTLSKNIKLASEEIPLTGYEPDFFFADFALSQKNIYPAKMLIDKKLIHSDEYSLGQYLSRTISYSIYNNELIASMGKEFINLSKNSLLISQPILDDKEYISNLCFKDDFAIYTTEKLIRKKHISQEALSYGNTDSIGKCYLKIQNMKSNELLLTQELKLKSIYTLSTIANLYEFIENKDSLKLNKYHIKF